MTKFTRFKMLLMALVMLVGSGNVWGATYTHTIAAKTWSAYGSQTLSGVAWTATATGGAYWGYDATKGQQFGSSGAPATSLSLTTSGISGTITSVKVSTSGASSVVGTMSVSVGATAFSPSSITLTATNTTYEFIGSASGSIVISWAQTSSKALYLKALEVTYTASTPTSASPPTFSPATGTYYSSQNVSLTSTTPGATIYYTTDGSDPDDTDTQYSTPIAVSTTTTIKAKAYKDGMDPSGIATATYTFPTINNVSNIAALRAGTTDGTVYKLTGEAVLTLKTTNNNNTKYIQDATGGIMIYDSGAKIITSYNVGDGITNLMGTLTTYNGMLEFVPVIDAGAATSTGNTVTPVEIDLANMANYPGQLVKVSGVTIDGTGIFAASTVYTLNSSSSTVLRSAYTDLPWIGSAIPTVPQDIVGVVLINTPAAQLIPRTISDFSNTVFSSPTILVSEATVPAMTAQVGATDTETITVSGQNLEGSISLAVTGTDYALFELSTNTIAPTDGTVTDVVVTITYTPNAAGSHTATLTLSSAGAESVVKTLTGSATWPPLAAPVADAAGAISQSGFTAIWGAVSGATSYEVNVYTKEESGGNATDLFISEYIEGSSYNKSIEIFNGTGASVDLGNYTLKKQTNGDGIYGDELTLSGTLPNNDVYVIAYVSGSNSASAGILAVTDLQSSSAAINFNGNDAVALFKSGVQIDEVGVFNQVTPNWGADVTLVRKSSVLGPKVTYDAADWDSFAKDVITNLGSHTFDGGGSSTTHISGSPFTVTGETTKAITGLSASTTYYYTVVAKNAHVDSDVSNEISVVTSFGTDVTNPELKNITAFDGKIRFSANAGQQVEVYNAVGQKLISAITLDGLNTLNVNAKGMMIVKVGDRLAKVIL